MLAKAWEVVAPRLNRNECTCHILKSNLSKHIQIVKVHVLDPGIALLRVYNKQVSKDLCFRILIITSFNKAEENEKQPECTSERDWLIKCSASLQLRWGDREKERAGMGMQRPWEKGMTIITETLCVCVRVCLSANRGQREHPVWAGKTMKERHVKHGYV